MSDKMSKKRRNEERSVYEKPVIEVIEMEMEAVICKASGGDFTPGNGFGN